MDNSNLTNYEMAFSNPESKIDKKIEQLIITNQFKEMEVEEIWQLMDDIWDELDCDNKKIEPQKLNLFYSHPIWLLNGLFIEQHELSIQNRRIIVDWISSNRRKIHSIIDFGGGFGTLARLIADENKDIVIDIYEPHPNPLAIEKINTYSKVNFINSFSRQYDCLVSTDVLEHVSEPLKLLAKMINSIEMDGYLIIVNCFYPVIKCHLPTVFHFRYSFNIFTKLMGLDIVKVMNGNTYVYKKSRDKLVNWNIIYACEKISILVFPLLRIAHIGYRFVRKMMDKNYAKDVEISSLYNL